MGGGLSVYQPNIVVNEGVIVEETALVSITTNNSTSNPNHDANPSPNTNTVEDADSDVFVNILYHLSCLESELQSELEYLESLRTTTDAVVSKRLTKVMICKIRKYSNSNFGSSDDLVCPICNDGWGNCNAPVKSVIQLPCSHLFHDACLMPWLNIKQNCPICRTELTDTIPEMEEFCTYSRDELLEKFKELDMPLPEVNVPYSIPALASMMHDFLVEYCLMADEAARKSHEYSRERRKFDIQMQIQQVKNRRILQQKLYEKRRRRSRDGLETT